METSLKNTSSIINAEENLECTPPNKVKRRRTDYDLEFIPRAIYNDFYAELQLREEGVSGKVNRSNRKVKQRIDTNPLEIPESLNLFSKAINLRQEETSEGIGSASFALMQDEDANDERTVILTEAGIDILNLTYQNAIFPLAKPKIASPLESPIHYFDNNRNIFKTFEKTYRYGSLLNTLASTNYETSSKCHAIGNDMDKKSDQTHRASTLRYTQPFKASESIMRARGVSFRARGFLDVHKGWAKASEYTGLTGDISDTSYSVETEAISFVKELAHPSKPQFASVQVILAPNIPVAEVTPISSVKPKASYLKSANDNFSVQSLATADRALTEPVVSIKETTPAIGTKSPSAIENDAILKSFLECDEERLQKTLSPVEDRVMDDHGHQVKASEFLTSDGILSTTKAGSEENVKSTESTTSVMTEDEEWLFDEKKRLLRSFKAPYSPVLKLNTDTKLGTIESSAIQVPSANTSKFDQLRVKLAVPEKVSRFDQLVKKMEKQICHNEHEKPQEDSNTQRETKEETPKTPQVESQSANVTPIVNSPQKAPDTELTSINSIVKASVENQETIKMIDLDLKPAHHIKLLEVESKREPNAEEKVVLPVKNSNRLNELVGNLENRLLVEENKAQGDMVIQPDLLDQKTRLPNHTEGAKAYMPPNDSIVVEKPQNADEQEKEKKKKGFFKVVASAIKKSVTNLKSIDSTENIASEKDSLRASVISKKYKKDHDTSESNDNLSKEKSSSKVSLRASFLNPKSGKSLNLKQSESMQSIPNKLDDSLPQPPSILDKLVIQQLSSGITQSMDDAIKKESNQDSEIVEKKLGPKTGRYLNALAMATAQTVPLNEVTKEKKGSLRASLLSLGSKTDIKSSESLHSIAAKMEKSSASGLETQKFTIETTPRIELIAQPEIISKKSELSSDPVFNDSVITFPNPELSKEDKSKSATAPISQHHIEVGFIAKPIEPGHFEVTPNQYIDLPLEIVAEQTKQSALLQTITAATKTAVLITNALERTESKINIKEPPLPVKEHVNEKDAESWLADTQKIIWKDRKCDLKVVDFELHCCESGKNKQFKPYLPLSLRRVLRVTPLKGSDVEIQCTIPRGDKDGSEFKLITITFSDASAAQKWRNKLIFLSFGGTYEETINREILILTEKSDKESQKLVEKYMLEILESSKRPCTVTNVQYNEFMITNVLASTNFAKIGNVILTNQDFVPRLQQVLVREQYSSEPINLQCEKDPVDAAVDIIRSAVGKKKLSSVHVTGLQLKREDKGLFSSFRK